MTPLKIGTVLIAKEDMQYYTKGKEYTILENDRDTNYKVSSNSLTIIHWFDVRSLINNFTIKRYTLTDLKDKKIAVKLRNKQEYQMLLKKLDCRTSSNYYDDQPIYGFDDIGFGLLYNDELEGRILLDSIDEIDLEEKEGLTTPLKVRTVDFLENLVRNYENEIARLKEENEKLQSEAQSWKDSYQGLFKRYNDLEQSQPLAGLESTTDQSERTRMAWELYVHNAMSIDSCFSAVDSFLAKSKEVKP